MDAHRAKLSPNVGMPLPNMRLKLTGALVLKETVVSCSRRHRLSPTTLALASESPAA